jgi:hypothetical protein
VFATEASAAICLPPLLSPFLFPRVYPQVSGGTHLQNGLKPSMTAAKL